ncbi:MAG TPA: hypothetical protein VGO47_15070, partial [Chlamydiales bacterium]|nr:hypothetical protein [Chlamydiales bacterium]
YALCSPENFLRNTSQGFCKGLCPHCPRNFDYLVESDISAVFDILFFLAIPWWLCRMLTGLLK